MLILIRFLAFAGMAFAFGLATVWKMGVIEESRTKEVVTIQGEYEKYGKPVVAVRVEGGTLHENQKVTLKPKNGRQLEAFVSREISRQLKSGQSVVLMGPQVKGQVQSVSASPDLLTGLYHITVRLNQFREDLPEQVIGSIAVRQIPVKVKVPRNAITRNKDKFYAWRIESGLAYKTPVKVGRSDELFYEITDGVKVGDTVITQGQRYLNDQQKIRLVSEDDFKFELAKSH